MAASVGVGAPVVDYLPGEGVLVVEFLPGRTYGPDDVAANLPRVAAAARRLHGGPEFASRFDMFEVQRGYLRIVRERGYAVPEGYDALAPAAARVEAALASRPEPLVPCHNDLLAANVLDDGGDLRFIDYEYSGMNEASFELGNLVNESQLDHDHLVALVEDLLRDGSPPGCSRGPSCGGWPGAGRGRCGGRSSTACPTSTTTSGTSRSSATSWRCRC